MRALVYFTIAVASFAVLAQPAVAQGTNTTLPLIYPGQILQGDGSQTCPSEAKREKMRNEVDNTTLRLLQESVVPLLQQTLFCGGSGWRRVAYLDMAEWPLPTVSLCVEGDHDPIQGVWEKVHHR